MQQSLINGVNGFAVRNVNGGSGVVEVEDDEEEEEEGEEEEDEGPEAQLVC